MRVSKVEPNQEKHEPLAFLSGSFPGSQKRWSVIQKEAFPIIEATDKLIHFLIKKQTVDKLCGWAAKLHGFRYFIQYDPGESNVWADILLRWKPENPGKFRSISPVRSLYEESFERPSLKEIGESRKISEDDCRDNLELDLELKVNSAGLIWVPKKKDIRDRICVIAHSGLAGHRGMRTTERAI